MHKRSWHPLTKFRPGDLLWDIIVSGRPTTSLIAGALTGATIASIPATSWSSMLRAAVALSFVTMAGFILNDVHDRAKDVLKSERRPIAEGTLSPRAGLVASTVLIVAALLSTPTYGGSRAVVVATAAGVILYSYAAYSFPSIKGIYTACLCCAPLVYGATVGGGRFTLPTYAALMVFISGREVLLDLQDVDVDRGFGLRTIPMLVGDSAARFAGIALMVSSACAVLLLVRSSFGYLAATLSLASLCAILSWPGINAPLRLRLTRIPMLLGALALATTVGTR